MKEQRRATDGKANWKLFFEVVAFAFLIGALLVSTGRTMEKLDNIASITARTSERVMGLSDRMVKVETVLSMHMLNDKATIE